MIKAAFDPVTLATPFFVLTVLLEIVLARFHVVKANYETKGHRDLAADGPWLDGVGHLHCGDGLRRHGVDLGAPPLHRADDGGLGLGGVFLLEDMTYYWFHRLSHERRFWWAAHVNHHTSSTTTSRRRCGRPGPAAWRGRGRCGCRWRSWASRRR
jgi:hypothetical protein